MTMRRPGSVTLLMSVLGLALTTGVGLAQKPAPVSSHRAAQRPSAPKTAAATAASADPQDHDAVIRRYCVTCHNETRKTGGLSLASFDVAHAAQNADVAERMIRKLQAGFMPPPLSP